MQQGEGTSEGRRLPSPAMILAVAALIAALGGTAVAVDKITSKDLAPNAVRSKHIKRGQVRLADTDLTKSRSATAARTTADAVELTDIALSAKLKRGDLVSIHGSMVVLSSGIDSCGVFLDISGAGITGTAPQVLRYPPAGNPQAKSFDSTDNGTATLGRTQAIDILIRTAGTLRVLPLFAAQGGGSECEIRSRSLSLTVSR